MRTNGYLIKHFNPLPRKEGDDPGKQGKTGAKGISIHSLVKRETVQGFLKNPQKQFQSTPS